MSTHHASIVDAVLPSAVFDVVLFSWFALGYVRSAKARASALSRSLQTLRPGGRILVSYQVRAEKPPAMSRIAQKVARAIGGVEVERGDEFNISGTAARPGIFFLHRFEPQEIADEARDAGLSVLDHTQPTNNVGVIVLVRSSQDS